MTKRHGLAYIVVFCCSLSASSIYAADLLDVYKDALRSDPEFKAARAEWLANKETLAIRKSALLPQIAASVSASRARNNVEAPGDFSEFYNNSSGYKFTFQQVIFDFSKLAAVWQSQAVAKSAQATFLEQEELLLSRVAEKYFVVLLAQENLLYAESDKEAKHRLFIQSKHKYDVGLTAITDFEQARSDYETAVAAEIATKNDLDSKLESLGETTGVRYKNLSPLKDQFPLLSPEPANIDAWAKAAERQNFGLLAANYNTIAARENVKLKNAGHLPTLTATGGYAYNYQTNAEKELFNRSKSASVGAELAIPIFQGGGVMASTKQADYQYQGAISQQEKAHREVLSKTRQSYLSIIASISKIKAGLQAIKSAASALRSMQAGYSVGKNTMTDILTAQSKLFEAQTGYAKDKHEYIMQLLTLKRLTGSLRVIDLQEINSWLVSDLKSQENNVAASKPSHKPSAKSIKKSEISNSKIDQQNTAINKIKIIDADKVEPAPIVNMN